MHDIDRLEREIKALQLDLNKIAGSARWIELLKMIHFPGYTTPAEFYLVDNVVKSMAGQVRVLQHLEQTLFEGSHIIVGKEVEGPAQ
ncbi:MAG TPA: hypothetical protein VLI05_02325 [Candidatus Saccharimonadia bacterium]|nr:hypothetical protein [Candidatus Saccharimonadia bacterium]